jgi:hypothetical protein
MLSTLRGHVEAMGGGLELLVALPGKPAVSPKGFDDAERART